MKKATVIFFLLVCACTPLAILARKHALVVGVSTYMPGGGWNNLNSHNDVVAVKEALLLQGFPAADIVVLEDSDATREGIIRALQKLQTSSASGDLVYFHFSGHGQQMWDESGDEIDGYDESIVPYDALKKYNTTGYKGQNHLSDEELGRYFLEIRKKLGSKGQLIVLLDSCHSGTGTRGLGAARGTDILMAPDSWISTHEKTSGVSDRSMSEQEQKEILAPYVAFFAADARELNWEISTPSGQMGPLTAAFVKSFRKISPVSTWSGVFGVIRNEMAITSPQQNPRAEGYLDRLVLAGTFVALEPHYTVTESDGQLMLSGGWLHGLTQDSRIGFFPAETRDYRNAKPVATGFVNSTYPSQCIVAADKPFSALKGTWAYALELAPGDMHLNVSLNISDTSLRRKLTEEMEKKKIFGFGKEYDCYLYQNIRGDSLFLDNSSGTSLGRFSTREPGLEIKVTGSLLRYAQGVYLRKLNFSDESEFFFTLEIVPVDTTKDGKVARLQKPINPSGGIEITEGAPFIIRVKNPGKKQGFFSLVDIDPNNKITILSPYCEDWEQAADFHLSLGQEFILPRDSLYFKCTQPYGMETVKLIVTDEPVDLCPVYRGMSRGGRTPIERIISNIVNPEETGTRGNNMPPASLGVFTSNFKIIGKKAVKKP